MGRAPALGAPAQARPANHRILLGQDHEDALDGSNAGRLSPASHNLVRPVLSDIAENHLSLVALRR